MNKNFKLPTLTIGMPVFNDRDFIEGALDSILNQSFRDFVLIISDDGATDGSEIICQNYAKKDDRIKYIRQEINLGISKNMQFLIDQAETKYFMWAGDDDLYDPEFITVLINLLEKNDKVVSAFCNYKEIKENEEDFYPYVISKDYSGSNKIERLKKFIKDADDGFGYGIFKTDAIKNVEFPVWWWPNKKTPLNNIFPTLCFYLAQGDFLLYNKDVLFLKRNKSKKNMNYNSTGEGNSVYEITSYLIRRINLVVFTLKLLRKSSGSLFAGRLFYVLFFHWFIKPCVYHLKLPIQARTKKITRQLSN